MSNIRSIFKHWKRKHKEFFKYGKVMPNSFAAAQESLVHCFEIYHVPCLEAFLYLPRLEYTASYMYCTFPILFGLALESYRAFSHMDSATHYFIWSVLVGLTCLLILGIWGSNRLYRQMSRRDAWFLQLALRTYLEPDSQRNDFCFTLTELRNGLQLFVPKKSESLYDDDMHATKYYWSAYEITVRDKEQDFSYVLYSNHYYSANSTELLRAFIRRCKEQIGKDWALDKMIISTTEIKPVSIFDI